MNIGDSSEHANKLYMKYIFEKYQHGGTLGKDSLVWDLRNRSIDLSKIIGNVLFEAWPYR